MSLESLLSFASIVFLIALIPGPNALLVLFTSLSNNKTHALLNISGVATGFIIHAFISALGLSLIIAQSAFAFTIIKFLGVLYLLYLGFSHIKAGFQLKTIFNNSSSIQNTNLFSSFLKGLLTNLLNPKIVLFYLSIFPQFVSSKAVFEQSILLGFIQALVVALWFFIIVFSAAYFKKFLINPKNTKWLNYISGSIFIIFGLKLAKEKLN